MSTRPQGHLATYRPRSALPRPQACAEAAPRVGGRLLRCGAAPRAAASSPVVRRRPPVGPRARSRRPVRSGRLYRRRRGGGRRRRAHGRAGPEDRAGGRRDATRPPPPGHVSPGADPALPRISSPACAQPRGTDPEALSTGGYPQAGAVHRRLSTGLCPTSPRFGSSARCVAERHRHCPEPLLRPGFRASERLLPCPHRPPERIAPTDIVFFPVDNSTPRLFAQVRR